MTRGTRTFWAPGRANLIGEHTDYSGGLVLPVALDLGVRIEGAPDDRIRLTSDRGEPVDLPADGGSVDEATGWGRFVAAVASELDALGRPAVGFAGHVSSDLPIGAGLSSSAALEVAVGTALSAIAGFSLDPLELARAGQRAEHRAAGVPTGIMDQAASVLGRADHAILLDTGSLAYEHVPLPSELALVIVDSGVQHAHADSGYATRRRELERALAALDGRLPGDLSAAEAEELGDRLEPVPARRLRHVVTENERVRRVVEVLREPGRPALAELGALFRAGHESLRDDFEVSTPELDLLVDLAYDAGALAARMTGGGFGGSVVVLVDETRAAELGAEVVAAYDAREGGPLATARTCRAADGARELS